MIAVQIHEAGDSDLAAVLGLYGHPDIDGPDLLTLDEAKEVLRRFKAYPNYRLFVACAEQKVVGTFSLLIIDNLAHRGSPSALVEDVVVAVDHQYQGIGKQMMQFAIDRCREAGCYKMALSSNLKRDAAHRFYEALGFEKHGFSFLIRLKEKDQPR
ncbi:MAG: GNAT family N-acetyltransferase [Opitutaceae bacterium]|nr:GNAT family N-acetyltransferase [Opitutaceae bacterium]